ncbi:MAG: hypothetical protein LLG93_07600 [Deltaproteobacteria bacterium]|nr:hypothetical protein [Deltaproteobacteria bacterium]
MPSWIQHFGSKAQGAVRVGSNAGLADGELVVIGDKTFEWDNNAAVTPGNILVTIGGSEAASITNLIAALTANPPSVPVEAHVDAIDNKVARLVATARGALSNVVFTTTMANPANIIAPTGGNLAGGSNPGRRTIARGSHVVTALDVAAGACSIETSLQNAPTAIQVEVRSAAGLLKAVTSLVTVDAQKRIIVDFDGATNPVAGDVIQYLALE